MNKCLIVALFFVVGVMSCQKTEMPTDDDIIDCEHCSFTYQVSGDSTKFTYKNYWGGERLTGSPPYNGLTFNVADGRTSFRYGRKEIKSDLVNYIVMCINCGVVPYQPVDGTIVGKKVDRDRWLVDGNVILEAFEGESRDTMVFKQYFTKVPAP